MKALLVPVAFALTLPLTCASAILFTNDTLIRFDNTNYDGQDISLTNCAVTIDGVHTFASVQILKGGKLTHDTGTNGVLENRISITNEFHTLTATNPVALNYSNAVATTIVVSDTNGITVYTNLVDYVVGADTNGFPTIARTPASFIMDGGVVAVSYDVLNTPVPTGLSLIVSNDFTIESG